MYTPEHREWVINIFVKFFFLKYKGILILRRLESKSETERVIQQPQFVLPFIHPSHFLFSYTWFRQNHKNNWQRHKKHMLGLTSTPMLGRTSRASSLLGKHSTTDPIPIISTGHLKHWLVLFRHLSPPQLLDPHLCSRLPWGKIASALNTYRLHYSSC